MLGKQTHDHKTITHHRDTILRSSEKGLLINILVLIIGAM